MVTAPSQWAALLTQGQKAGNEPPCPRLVGACRALADRGIVRHQPWRQERSRGGGGRIIAWGSSRARRVRPLCPLWRDRCRRGGGDKGDGYRAGAGARSHRLAERDVPRGSAQCPRLRFLGPRGEICGPAPPSASPPSAAAEI